MCKKEEIEMKQAVVSQMVTVKCDTCGHKFDSDPYEWVWDGDAMGSPFPCPPDCPICGGNMVSPVSTEVERVALCKTLGIGGGANAPLSKS